MHPGLACSTGWTSRGAWGSSGARRALSSSGGRLSIGESLEPSTVGGVTPETRAAIAHLEASGLIAEAIAAVRVDHAYAVEIAREHARLARQAEGVKARAAARPPRPPKPRVPRAPRAAQPRKLSAVDIAAARERRAAGERVADIAESLGVARATLYAVLRAVEVAEAAEPPRKAGLSAG